MTNDVPNPPIRISVALATWNGERFLDEQLNSLARQTYLPYELVVSDDQSSDQTVSLVEEFARNAPFPVSVNVNATRLGYGDNFLRAASLCSGDYVAFCDQDDVWLPTKLWRCRELLHASRATLLVHRALVVTEALVPTGRRVPAIHRALTAPPLNVDPWLLPPGNAMVVSRAIFDFDHAQRPGALSSCETQMAHDEWTYFVATSIGTTHFSPETLVQYRQHRTNVFGAPPRFSFRRSVAPGSYIYVAARANERSAFFRDLAETVSADALSYERAAEHYGAIADRFETRAGVYSAGGGIGGRLGHFIRLAATSGYNRRNRGGFGLRSFFKDLVAGVGLAVAPSADPTAEVQRPR